jgi:heme/copper-type cytochrome/quinol oxidase subunit 2
VGSVDVLHAFALPDGGIKVDVVPGRTNSLLAASASASSGVHCGQCSEICGTFHGFMPLSLLRVAQK